MIKKVVDAIKSLFDSTYCKYYEIKAMNVSDFDSIICQFHQEHKSNKQEGEKDLTKPEEEKHGVALEEAKPLQDGQS